MCHWWCWFEDGCTPHSTIHQQWWLNCRHSAEHPCWTAVQHTLLHLWREVQMQADNSLILCVLRGCVFHFIVYWCVKWDRWDVPHVTWNISATCVFGALFNGERHAGTIHSMMTGIQNKGYSQITLLVLILSHECAHTNKQQGPGHKKLLKIPSTHLWHHKSCLQDPASLNQIYNGHSKNSHFQQLMWKPSNKK